LGVQGGKWFVKKGGFNIGEMVNWRKNRSGDFVTVGRVAWGVGGKKGGVGGLGCARKEKRVGLGSRLPITDLG